METGQDGLAYLRDMTIEIGLHYSDDVRGTGVIALDGSWGYCRNSSKLIDMLFNLRPEKIVRFSIVGRRDSPTSIDFPE
jgi:hypothetical protein